MKQTPKEKAKEMIEFYMSALYVNVRVGMNTETYMNLCKSLAVNEAESICAELMDVDELKYNYYLDVINEIETI